jgi:uncharacterized membrane protein (UPF0127 family)
MHPAILVVSVIVPERGNVGELCRVGVIVPFYMTLAALVQGVLLAGSPNTVTINGHMFSAEISRTFEQKVKGLMFREELPSDSCMLFLYYTDANRSIWMKNTKMPLDVIWISESGNIVEIQENVPPCVTVYESQTCPEYGGGVPARHFIEFPAGTVSKIGIKSGDIASLELLVPHDGYR